MRHESVRNEMIEGIGFFDEFVIGENAIDSSFFFEYHIPILGALFRERVAKYRLDDLVWDIGNVWVLGLYLQRIQHDVVRKKFF